MAKYYNCIVIASQTIYCDIFYSDLVSKTFNNRLYSKTILDPT